MIAQIACWHGWRRTRTLLCVSMLLPLFLPIHLHATSITVTTCTDGVPGSLRDALARAGDGDTIGFGLDCPADTPMLLNGGPLIIRTNLTVDGSGHTVTLSGGGMVGLLEVTGGIHLTMNALTLVAGARMFGAGIDNNGGTVVVTASTFRGNVASFAGGGIYTNGGSVTVMDCTFVEDTAGQAGGGIANNGGTLTVINSTFARNSADRGGGIANLGTATLTNTLVAASGGGALSGAGFGGTHNLIDDAAGSGGFIDGTDNNLVGHPALLGPLDPYGDPTGVPTLALLPGSPAIDAGSAATPVPPSDQRGKPRVGVPDIGAFESQGFTLTIASGTDQAAPAGTAFVTPLAVKVTSAAGESVQGGQVAFMAPARGASATLTGSTATVGSDGVARVTATANRTVGGPYTVVASAAGASPVTFVLRNIAPRILLSPGVLPNGMSARFYSEPFVASGGSAPYQFRVAAGALPDGLILSTSGVLTGTPRAAQTNTFTVQVTDADGFTGRRSYTLAIAAPTISLGLTLLSQGMVGVSYPYTTFSATGGTGPYMFSVTIGSLPLGMTLSASGTLSGTPMTAGVYYFTIAARDAAGFVGSQSYTLTIAAASLS